MLDDQGKAIVEKQTLLYKTADDAVGLAYKLFNIGTKIEAKEGDAGTDGG